MYLLYCVLFLCFTALLFAVTLLGTRNPSRPFWAGDDISANILVPLIVFSLVMGIGFIAKAFIADFKPGMLEWGCSAVATVVTVAGIKMMGIRKRLDAFLAEETKRGEVIKVDFQANRTPELPINDAPNFRKAA